VPQPGRGREPHPETLLDAAALAVHHSDLRGETAEVTVTQRKHVRAIPGAAPGRVTVAAARTLTVRDAEERVRRLTAASPE
jgi:predicted ribosome quality control (RQC) complex YloA/Tae2 family protein